MAVVHEPVEPVKVIIGKRAANVAQSENVTVDGVENAVTYTVTINGTAFDFLSDADATDDEITAGLTSAINLGAEPVTATDNIDGTLDLDADVAGVAFTVVVSDDGAGTDLSVAVPRKHLAMRYQNHSLFPIIDPKQQLRHLKVQPIFFLLCAANPGPATVIEMHGRA